MDREKLFYESNKNTYNFKEFQATFDEDIYNREISLDEAEYQSDLANKINDFIKKRKPHTEEKKQEKKCKKEPDKYLRRQRSYS